MLELEIDMVDRVINQQQYNQDHVHDKQYVMNYQDLLLELQNQLQVSHHHNPDMLNKEFIFDSRLFKKKKSNSLPQRRCKEFALAFPDIFGG